jgi:Helix-turn-helix
MTGDEIDRLSGAGHLMQRYLQYRSKGELWFLTTAKGTSREAIASIQKRIGRLQQERDFYSYSAWCFETRPKLHAHILFVGDSAVVERLKRGAFAEIVTIKHVYNLPRLLQGYQAKERTPQAGWGRGRQLGGRIKGSHKLDGGGDRVRLSRELERDAVEAGLVSAWQHSNAKRKADRKEYRKRPLTARAPRLSGQILLFPELSKPVARLQAFGGGYIPRAVASEIEFRRQQLGLSQRQLAALVGRSQGQLANAIRGHDPISARVVNRLRDVLLTAA